MRENRNTDTTQIVLLAILLLFFLQVFTDFIQSTYALELLVTALTLQAGAFVLMFSPILLVFLRRPPARRWMVAIACVAMLGRLIEPMLNPGSRLVACGISVGAFMLLFPMLLAASPRPSQHGWRLASALLIAVSLSITLRTVDSSLDVSEYGIFQFIAWVLAALAGRLIWMLELGDSSPREMQPARAPETIEKQAPGLTHEERREASLRSLAAGLQKTTAIPPIPAISARVRAPSSRRVIGLCIGMAAAVIMIYFGFGSPAVFARWSESSYLVVVAVLVIALGLLALVISKGERAHLPGRGVILAWNALFVVMLVLTILPHQVAFPGSPGRYPLDAPGTSPICAIPLVLMLLSSPVIYVDFMLYIRQLSTEAPSIRQLGWGFTVAAIFAVIMIFLHVFTTVYDYTAPVGTLFRDRFWLVYLVAGLALILPLLYIPAWSAERASGMGGHALTAQVVGVLSIVCLGALILGLLNGPVAKTGESPSIRVMTYNIQQGFDKVGNAALPAQLAAMRRVAPDVLGIQESDTARIANGNVDAVRFFADNLGMYSYYGPTTTVGTFGIGLLSKYPIQKPRTFFMFSSGEQTACIQAQITVNGKTYNLFVTHLGNDGPMVQLQDVLERMKGLQNVILMGDFNFGQPTQQYALATTSLADAWLTRWPSGHAMYPFGAAGRIDQIFVSPGTQVLEADYVADGSSDHPYLYAVLKP